MVYQVGPAPLPRPSASTDAGGPGSLPHISDEELLADFRRYEELRMTAAAAGHGASTAASAAADAAVCRGEKALDTILRQPAETWAGMSRPVLDAFYCFAFAVCRNPGKKHLQVERAVALWRVILRGRFRLLDRFCEFVASSPRLVINEDTWRQVLDFSKSVMEDLSNFDVSGAWPVLLDEFVESLQVQRARPSTRSSRSVVRPTPWTMLWPGSSDALGSEAPALAGVSPVAGSKRRAPDVDSITSRLEAARLANLSCPHASPLGASSVHPVEQLTQPLKRLHVVSSAS